MWRYGMHKRKGMGEMKVAVIDNGVDSERVDCLQEVDLSEKYSIEKDEKEKYEKEKYGHGTICAAIIKKYAPEAEVVSLKVMDESAKTCSLSQVQSAFSYCMNQGIRLVSMGMGTRNVVETVLLYDSVAKATYVADDAKQREKMTEEFLMAARKELEAYQGMCEHLIQSDSQSVAVMSRYIQKYDRLIQRVKNYEDVLHRRMAGLQTDISSLGGYVQELHARCRRIELAKSSKTRQCA